MGDQTPPCRRSEAPLQVHLRLSWKLRRECLAYAGELPVEFRARVAELVALA